MKQNEMKGITLIALVITIIVLLILAGVAIVTLTGDNGILTKAASAKEKTERAEVIENAKLDILAIQSDKEGKLTTGDLKGVLDKYFKDVPEEITAENIATLELKTKDEKHTIKVSEIYNGKLEGTNGSMSVTELKVGDYVNYGDKLAVQTYRTKEDGEPDTGYETSQTFNTNTTTLWRVINKKANGDVEIVAVNNTLSSDGTTGLYLKSQNGFLNAETVLNNLCSKLYANPAYGTARSINVDDINNLTGFNPETDATNYNKPYTYTSGGPFWDKNTNTFRKATAADPVTVDNTYYYYTVNENIPLYDTLIEESKTYTGDYDEENYPMFYWLASRGVAANDGGSSFIVRIVGSGVINCWYLFNAYANGSPDEYAYACAVRPIVTLRSSVQIDTSDTTKDGSEQGKAWILK